MKKTIFILTLLTALFTACDKWPANGDLDGQWQLMEIDDNGNKRDMKDKHLYCSFQLKLFMLGEKNFMRHYFGYFEHDAKTIRFYSFTYRSGYTETNNYDKPMTDEEDLDIIAPWGFYSVDSKYNVVELTSQKLVLKHDKTTITYRKL